MLALQHTQNLTAQLVLGQSINILLLRHDKMQASDLITMALQKLHLLPTEICGKLCACKWYTSASAHHSLQTWSYQLPSVTIILATVLAALGL